MDTIRVGGVPEHFNLPWHLAIENGHFEKKNVKVEWQTFGGGTGAMTKALRENNVDVCVLLTEGITADIIKGNPAKILSKYINTPLIWGVHTGAQNELNYYAEVYEMQYAISRFGSGSHLMPQVDAFSKKRKLQQHQFTIIKNLDGAIASLDALETDVFYWEKYMTQPYVDNGKLRRLGEYVTPWPCFLIAATDQIIADKPEALKNMLESIYFVNEQFMTAPNSIEEVSNRHGLTIEDTTRWFYSTEWAISNQIKPKMLENVIHTLHATGIIPNKVPAASLCKNLFQ